MAGAKETLEVGIDSGGAGNMQTQGSHRRRAGTLSADYGGKVRSDEGKNSHRPEAVKSLRCDDTKCQMCTHKTDDGCWQPRMAGSSGDMELAVKADNPFKSFAQEVFFKCPMRPTKGYWNFKVNAINNGKIKVYVNRKLVKIVTKKGDNFIYPVTKNAMKKQRVRLVFVPIDRKSVSSARAKVETKAMYKGVDVCMSSQGCLSELGDGSEADFELRNNNRMQLTCLQSAGNGDSAWEASEKTKCKAWDLCLPEENKKIIKTLLKAAIRSGSPSFADVASTARGNLTVSEDPNECINPAVDDPESWDCECIDDMITSCDGVSQSCFKGIMCKNAGVCQSWKDEVDCAAHVSSSAHAALGQRGQEHASSGIGDALDGSLQGKCSQ